MKMWMVATCLIFGFVAHAESPAGIILVCKNAGKNRVLKVEDHGQSYRIAMTDYAEKQLLGATYVLKTKDVIADASQQSLVVNHANGTAETYSLQIQELYATHDRSTHLGRFVTLSGDLPVGTGTTAREKVYKTLVPESSKFDMQILECPN